MSRHLNRDSEIKPLAIHADSDQVYKLSHAPQFKNAEQFIKAKLKILVDEHCIRPTEIEIAHLNEIARESEIKHWNDRKAESEINRAVRQIINDHWR